MRRLSEVIGDKLGEAAEPARTPQQGMFEALNRTKRWGEVYGGTVPAKVIARRRAANKRARLSRRANR